jgi:tight adherence protein B
MVSPDFAWVVMAVRIQREVGGNLAELLLTVSATLREREYLRRQVRTLSAEGRMSAWVLGLLPPAFFGYLMLVQPSYLDPMIHSLLGWLMLGAAGVMMAVGVLIMSKMVKVEV